MARYSKKKIAAAKALMADGVGPKLLARISDIPFHTLRNWDAEKNNATVQPTPGTLDKLKRLWSEITGEAKPDLIA